MIFPTYRPLYFDMSLETLFVVVLTLKSIKVTSKPVYFCTTGGEYFLIYILLSVITVSQEPRCAQFCHVFTPLPIV